LRLVGDYQEYFAVAQPLFDKSFIVGTQREHRAILHALNERDGDNAADLIVRHILGAARFIQTAADDRESEKTTR
jgi:DNA-binding GntR family transcriptional regulator